MDFFKMITTHTADPGKKNAVIMGRKTWFSIPEKFRPLKDRINIVLSRDMKEAPEGVIIARSLQEAVSMVTSGDIATQVEGVHIIGGSSVYQEAMSGPYNCRIYLTRILAHFHCDTFLPEIDEKVFNKIRNPDNVPTDLQEEKDIKFRFEVYDKHGPVVHVAEASGAILNGPITLPSTDRNMHDLTMESAVTNLNLKDGPMKKGVEDLNVTHEPIKFNVMAAMCDKSRGIAFKLKLPWPFLRKDYEHYTTMTNTRQNVESDKKIFHIRGRVTWECCGDRERHNVQHIIVSNTMKECTHPRVVQVVRSFREAVEFCNTTYRDHIDSVWVMGGAAIYKEAIGHPGCDKLYITRVYEEFPSDTQFPPFEDDYVETSDQTLDTTMQMDNDVHYQFKVYKKKNGLDM